MENIEIIQFISGIGIFLFGIEQLELSLKALSSRSLKLLLRKHTNNPVKAIIGGTFATAILQSSSVVGLMILAFVGAGILDMRNALGVILGSNLGTTFTGWVVATLGFTLNLASFYLPLVGVGCLGLVAIRQDSKLKYFSQLLLGVGLLLMGLVLMKESIEALSTQFDVSVFSQYGIWVFFLVGVIFTAIIQSSSATMMITLSALNANVIPLEAAAALVIGADLGTTGTVMLGAIKGSPRKRQVAAAHFFFNLVTDVLALLCLPLLISLINNTLGLDDPLLSLVAFHSTFNVIGILLFLPFLGKFSYFLEKLIKKDTSTVSQFILTVPTAEIEESLLSLEKEIQHLFHRVIYFNLRCFKVSPNELTIPHGAAILDVTTLENEPFTRRYEKIKQLENEIVDFSYRLQKDISSTDDALKVQQLLDITRDIAYSAKEIKDIREDLIYIRQSENPFIHQLNHNIAKKILTIYRQCYDFFTPHNQALLLENHEGLHLEIDHYKGEMTRAIYKTSTEQGFSEQDLSTLLNVVSEYTLSNTLLLRAMHNYLLRK